MIDRATLCLCIKTLCPLCAAGKPIEKMGDTYVHGDLPCESAGLRKLLPVEPTEHTESKTKKRVRIYTKQGDHGQTSVPFCGRVKKGDLITHALGDIDELNAHIGLVREAYRTKTTLLKTIQNWLLIAGGELSIREPKLSISGQHVSVIEEAIDSICKELPPIDYFILPSYPSHIHIARAVCRRAERNICNVLSSRESEIIGYVGNPHFIVFFNRLSDFLFVLARYVNMKDYSEEEKWDQNA